MNFDITAALKSFGKGMAQSKPGSSVSDRLGGGFGGVAKKRMVDAANDRDEDERFKDFPDDLDAMKRRNAISGALSGWGAAKTQS